MRTDMEMKQQIEQRQRKFFADASHELKTPISIIKGYSEGLKDGVSEGKRERYIEIIADEAVKMETMVEEMLDLVRLESQAVRLNTDAVALGDMIEDIAGRLGPQLKDKGLEVVLVSTTEQSVEGDRSKLEQVIYNMMMNAIRHAVPHTDIVIEISRPEGQVRISIENKGERISEAERQYIWERFYRVERSLRKGVKSMKSLPSILTLGNLTSGMLAVIMAIHGEFALAVTLIWVAMFFDLFDGFAARKLHCEGEFGKALDSLADVISFGTAPVLILYLNSMYEVRVLT
ncbi:hypothetical protein G195_001687 [Phytophthora kernoviae 00238/432]|uniref:Uncharacterized sensor-like histidine kinase ycf26 n=1 Tax=Phytophthora kernoviae 00238/432 TaxID=1284355 RepID=A0A8J4STF4_9STRA|nr:hypothetical protein G195_001687 [Phytophthora kernoviae 00238/432]